MFVDPVSVNCRSGAPIVCLLADPGALNILVALTLPVGAADEGTSEHGVTYYLGHLTFRNRAAEDGQMISTRAGIDGFGNVCTFHRATTYHRTVPLVRPEGAAAQERASANCARTTRSAAAD